MVTAAEVARRIDVPPDTLRRWVRAGVVPQAGFPLVAFPQLIRVYGQSLAQIADAVVGHVEAEAEFDLGRLRVAIAFADLAGCTRLTAQAGEEEAVDVVERFIAGAGAALPDAARAIETIGGEVLGTRTVVATAGSNLSFTHIGEVPMQGFSEPTELFAASLSGELRDGG